MADLRTEEEQLEALKRWWKENGRASVLGIVVAIAIVVGWRGWQDHQQNFAEQGSVLYQNLVAATAVAPGQSLSEENRKTAEHLAGRLKEEFADLAYSQYAALWLAKNAVEQNDLAVAQQELQWVLDSDPEQPLLKVTQLRLARVLLAKGEPEQALEQLQGAPAPGFETSFYEVQGDIYKAMERDAEARQAYQNALASLQADQRPLLAMKLDDLTVAEDN